MSAPIVITMPTPPSLNKLWRTAPGKRRVRSQEYSDWLRTAGWEVRRQMVGVPEITCRYDMELHVPISRRDTGNWEKGISDLLQACGVVSNDGNLHKLTVLPLHRDNCAVCLTPLPDMGEVRKPAKHKSPRSYAPQSAKTSARAIARFEKIRTATR